MKSWWILLFAAFAGVAVGAGNVLYEQYSSAELFFPEDYASSEKQETVTSVPEVNLKKTARVEVVGDAVFDFGSMERSSKMRHAFHLKNVGSADLTLEPGRTTCKCTVSKIDLRTVPPGHVAEVILEWTGQTLSPEPEFAQTADINTNDPENKTVQLKIEGYVTETIRTLPEELVVGDVSSNTGSEAEFRLFGFRSDHMEILETTWESPTTADYFAVSYEPLAIEEVKKEKGATCGVLAKVTLKPGLPVGPLNQTISIRANVEKETVVEIPIRGITLSDIRIASLPNFDSNRNLLSFGALQPADAAKAVLQLYVTGPHRHETHLSVGQVDPSDRLKVEIGPPRELNNGKAIQFLVTIEIPAGGTPINRMGSDQAKWGRVVLETTHPQTKQVPIRVKFAVE
ncbi:MAG: DUF1573 domain-containing protein [Pirellulaceae bacterium]